MSKPMLCSWFCPSDDFRHLWDSSTLKYQHVAGVKQNAATPNFELVVTSSRKKRKSAPKHRQLIGDAIRAYRKHAAMTQETLAELVNLNPKYIGEVERGEKIISIEALMRIAMAVGRPVKEFFRDI